MFACFLLPLRFLECLLRQASNALIVHCPTMRCFVNQKTDSEPSFRADEFSDVSGRSQSLITVMSQYVNIVTLVVLSVSYRLDSY